MLKFAMSDRGCTDDQTAIGYCFGYGLKHLGFLEDIVGTDGGNGFAEGEIERVYQAQAATPEIANRARGCTDVQRVAGLAENYVYVGAELLHAPGATGRVTVHNEYR